MAAPAKRKAMVNLGSYYRCKNDEKNAIKYYKMAWNDIQAFINLGKIYLLKSKDYKNTAKEDVYKKKAITYLLRGSQCDDPECVRILMRIGIDPDLDINKIDDAIKLNNGMRKMFGNYGAYDIDW